jgi:hypothetical protein
MKYLMLFTFLLLSCQASANVYKCTVNGETVYQQTPCSEGGGEIEIRRQPSADSASPASPGLRDSEKALLEKLQAESEPPEPRQQPRSVVVTNATRSCSGIEVRSFSPYTVSLSDPYGYRGIDPEYMGINQCARVELKLGWYNGRLRVSIADEIRPRFYARFTDGSVQAVYSISVDGPDRVSPVDNEFSAKICFGESDYDIEQVGCR